MKIWSCQLTTGEQILQQAESEVSDIYSEVFEDDDLQASLVKEYSDAESVQSSWHSPDQQMEPAANAYIQTSGELIQYLIAVVYLGRLHWQTAHTPAHRQLYTAVMCHAGTLLKPQVFSHMPTTEPVSTRPGSIVKAGTVAYR